MVKQTSQSCMKTSVKRQTRRTMVRRYSNLVSYPGHRERGRNGASFRTPMWPGYEANLNYIGPARVHKNGRLEEERVTPIEVHSPVKMIEPYQNRTPGTCLATCLRTAAHTCYYF